MSVAIDFLLDCMQLGPGIYNLSVDFNITPQRMRQLNRRLVKANHGHCKLKKIRGQNRIEATVGQPPKGKLLLPQFNG